jgi:hypothetical protein
MPLQLEQWDDAIGPGLVLADDRRRGDDLSPHEFALRDRQLARRRVERFRADLDMHRRICRSRCGFAYPAPALAAVAPRP